ncbi:MAG: hypothetical protein ACI35S_05490 [Anaeroplasma sp.]
MRINCSWLTKELDIDLNNFREEYEYAYSLFVRDFVKSHPSINGKPVEPRYYPDFNGKYHSFDHITTKDYNRRQGRNSSKHEDREPDIRRLERIEWVRLLIEHPNCIPLTSCDCKGTMLWYEDYKNTYRVNILLPDENFMVVFEKNKKFDKYLLVTAYYLYGQFDVERKIKKYEANKNYIPNPL